MKKLIFAWLVVVAALVAIQAGDTAEIEPQEVIYVDPAPLDPEPPSNCSATHPGSCDEPRENPNARVEPDDNYPPIPATKDCKRYDLNRDGGVDMKDVKTLIDIVARTESCK